MDFKLIKATPKAALERVQRIVLEVPVDAARGECPPLYAGRESCDEQIKYLRSLGFSGHCPVPAKGQCEVELYVRKWVATRSNAAQAFPKSVHQKHHP